MWAWPRNLVVAESQSEHWRQNVRSGIPSGSGIEIFSRVLAAGPRRVVATPHSIVETANLARAAVTIEGPPTVDAAGANALAPERVSKQATGSSAEASLTEIWSELLGVSDIDLDADFFELGGHSLLATRMMSRIYENLGVRISLREVFDAPTVRKLALRIDLAQSGSDPHIAENEEEREELIF